MDNKQLIVILAVAVASYFALQWRRRRPPYPPGPKGLPFFGVVTHPKEEAWKAYAEWDKQYGGDGIISFHISGRRMVVINSVKRADDLLSKRSENYSDRPFPMMGGLLLNREKSIFFIAYNQRLKMYRKLLLKAFNPSASQVYRDVQDHEAHILVDNLLQTPDRLIDHLRRTSASLILKIGFGYDVSGIDDYLVQLAEENLTLASMATAPGRWLVDSWPLLRFVPSWMPGAGFKRKAKDWGQRLYNQSLVPHEYVKKQMEAGEAFPSFTASSLQTKDGKPVDSEMEDIVLWTAGALYTAGTDTSFVAMKNFILLMILYPEVQKRAQQEIDDFIARENRIPTCRDRPSMPYVEAVMKETFRWMPSAPLGVSHCSSHDDVYDGYYIPAKTPILTNIWAMMHDESVYPNPSAFTPDRFLEGEGKVPQPDPLPLAFGFGRRVCPGKTVAENSFFIDSTLILATVQLSKSVDEKGQVIEPEVMFSSGFVSHIKPFKYQIKERSPQAVAMVRQALAAYST